MEQQIRKDEKKLVRNRMKRMRRGLSEDQVMCFSAGICERLLSMSEIQQAETILLYAAVRGEADPGYLARALAVSEEAATTRKTLAYPRICGDEMDFYEIRSSLELVPGAFGIPEPAEGAHLLHPAANAVILVPGVAFMKNGNRIGMGRGYYDRYLAHYPNLLKIGIAYEAQMEAVWEPEERDLPMDIIVTENQVISCHPTLSV